MRRYALALMTALFVVLSLSVIVLASDGLPWDNLEVTVGGVVLLWGAVVAALVQLGKAIRIGGNPLLDTPGKIWGANLVLGGVGVLIHQLLGGAPVLAAIVAAVSAVLSAAGVYEGAKTALGKSSRTSSSGEWDNISPGGTV